MSNREWDLPFEPQWAFCSIAGRKTTPEMVSDLAVVPTYHQTSQVDLFAPDEEEEKTSEPARSPYLLAHDPKDPPIVWVAGRKQIRRNESEYFLERHEFLPIVLLQLNGQGKIRPLGVAQQEKEGWSVLVSAKVESLLEATRFDHLGTFADAVAAVQVLWANRCRAYVG